MPRTESDRIGSQYWVQPAPSAAEHWTSLTRFQIGSTWSRLRRAPSHSDSSIKLLVTRPRLWLFRESTTTKEPNGQSIATGNSGLIAASTHPSVEIVVVASSGHVAIAPTIQALELGKTVALANKETLVCAGEIIAPPRCFEPYRHSTY